MVKSACFAISAFGDEIASDLSEQLSVLRELDIHYLDLRSVWGKNVLRLEDEEVARVAHACAASGIRVSCIASPIGKSPLAGPHSEEVANLERIFHIAHKLDVRRVRIFSFYPPDTSTNRHYDQHVPEAIERLADLVSRAEHEGFLLLLENERAIVGDTVQRCYRIVEAIGRPYLRFLWDPANFVLVGETEPTTCGWPLLGRYVAHVHVKDARAKDGSVVVAGAGDGQVRELLEHLRDCGYHGYLSLEPHLALAGHSTGFSGAEGMRRASIALRQLMAETECTEVSFLAEEQ